MNEEADLFKDAQLGIEAEKFLSTDLGKFLLNKAAEELEQSYQGLLTVSPFDTDAIMQLQSKGQRAIQFQQWLNEAISNGKYAEQELQTAE